MLCHPREGLTTKEKLLMLLRLLLMMLLEAGKGQGYVGNAMHLSVFFALFILLYNSTVVQTTVSIAAR